MPRKYVVGTEYLVLSRTEDATVARLEGTFLSNEDAVAKKKELHSRDDTLRVKIETRTVYNTSESIFKTTIPDNPTESEPQEVEEAAI